ncbi:oligosaccharyl transferase delta subunit [Mycena amicta]|nr:oligosaccharyl transferase delta subunit [Mycena amicta]
MRLLLLFVAAATARAAVLSLYAPRVTTFDSTGVGIRTEKYQLATRLKIPLILGPTDSLKLTFMVVKEDTTDGVQPEGIQPLRVTPAGKSKFELNMAKPPASIPPTTTDPLEVTIIIGHPDHSPLSLHLFDLILTRVGVRRAAPRRTLVPPPSHYPSHFQRPAQDPACVPFLPSLQLLLPLPGWFFLRWYVALHVVLHVVLSVADETQWSQVFPGVPHLFSPRILPFIATLGAFEVLLVYYWIDLRLGQVLLYGGALGVVTLFTGNTALSAIGARRVGSK